MRDFKFFNNNDEGPLGEFIDERYNGASWMYGLRENLIQYEYDIVEEGHYGIHSFLDNFPAGFVVTILSITGPNNRIHTHITDYNDGWGFDILRDRIIVEWVRFRNDNER